MHDSDHVLADIVCQQQSQKKHQEMSRYMQSEIKTTDNDNDKICDESLTTKQQN